MGDRTMRSRAGFPGSIAAALCLGVGLAGCGGSAGTAASSYRDTHPLPLDTMTVAVAEAGTYGGRFVMAQTNSPRTFNAIMANETSSTDLTDGRLFVGLTDFNRATQVNYPMLAKSWDVSPDGLTWTWHLRRGAAFSDGHPITSEDVLFSYAVCMDSILHPSIQELLKVGGKPLEMSAPDSYTVVTKIAST